MNILFACNSYYPNLGGAEKVCKDMVHLLKHAGHNVVVLTQPVKEREENYDMTVFKEFDAKSAYSYMPELNEFLQESDFDVYISFGYGKYFTDEIGRFCKASGKKSIFMPCGDFHTNQGDWKKILYAAIIGKQSFNNYDVVITATEWEKQHWVDKYKVSEKKFCVIPYVLDSNFAKYKTTEILKLNKLKEKDYLLYIGRTGPNKKINWLIKAFIDSECKIPLVVAGLGTDSEDLKGLAMKHGEPRDNIKFLGKVSEDDKKTLIANAKVCVFPSLYESFGMVILESIALGTPVLLSNIPSFKELVKDNTVFFENTVASMSERLTAFLSSTDASRLPKVNFATDMNKLLWLVLDGPNKADLAPVCNIKTFRVEKR